MVSQSRFLIQFKPLLACALALGIILPPLAHAEVYKSPKMYGIQATRHSANTLTLEAPCSEIGEMILSLSNWKSKLGETPSSPGISSDGFGDCSVNIADIAPSMITALQDTTTLHAGPNCFNTSLYTNRIPLTRRHTTEEEFTFWLSSPLCRPLSKDEPLATGDIIAIRQNIDSTASELHGFTYITKDLAFSKSGYHFQFPYELVSSEYVFEIFALGKEISAEKCRRVEGTPADCPVWANYYRCTDYPSFVQSTKFQNRTEFLNLDQKLTALEKKLSQLVLSEPYTADYQVRFLAELAPLESKIDQALAKHQADPSIPASADELFLLKSLKARIQAYHEQFTLLNRGY